MIERLKAELAAIEWFDIDFLLADQRDQLELHAFAFRQRRRAEILRTLQELAARN